MKKAIFAIVIMAASLLTPGAVNAQNVDEIGAEITHGRADTLAETFQANFEGMPSAYLISGDLIQNILDQSGVAGLAVYMGQDPDTEYLYLVFVGVDNDGGTTGMAVDGTLGNMCPPNCGGTKPPQKPYGGHEGGGN